MTNELSLADLVRTRRRQLGLSYREVSKIAKSKGYSLTYTAINDYERGRTLPREDKVDALAAGLSLPRAEIIRAISQSEPPEPEVDLPEYALLSEENRQAVRTFAQALLTKQRQVEQLSDMIHATLDRADELAKEALGRVEDEAPDTPPWAALHRQLEEERAQIEDDRQQLMDRGS